MVNSELEGLWAPDDGRRGGYLFIVLILAEKEAHDIWTLHPVFILSPESNVKFLIWSNSSQNWNSMLLRVNLLNIECSKMCKNGTQAYTLTSAIHSFISSLSSYISSASMWGIALCCSHLYVFQASTCKSKNSQNYNTFLSNQLRYVNQDCDTFKKYRRPFCIIM